MVHGEGERRHEIYLGELDLVLELVEAVVEAAEAVDILLVLPRHLRLRAVPLLHLRFACGRTGRRSDLQKQIGRAHV